MAGRKQWANLSDEEKQKWNKYRKEWRAVNAEKWKRINTENVKRWREKNPEKYKAQYMTYNKKIRQSKRLDKK